MREARHQTALEIVDALQKVLAMDLSPDQRKGYEHHLAYWRKEVEALKSLTPVQILELQLMEADLGKNDRLELLRLLMAEEDRDERTPE